MFFLPGHVEVKSERSPEKHKPRLFLTIELEDPLTIERFAPIIEPQDHSWLFLLGDGTSNVFQVWSFSGKESALQL